MPVSNPLLELNNGIAMPAHGLGVFRSAPEDTAGAVETAIAEGYRLIDTAAAYNNEEQVGEGIRRSGIDRSELFITTKLWMSDYGFEPALAAFDASLRGLGVDVVDLYLVHWPTPSNFDATVQAYKACEQMLADGRTRAIGVCNFNPGHLRDLVERTEVVPAVNQVELHPWFIQRAVRDADAEYGLITQSWSPIGGVYVKDSAVPDQIKTPLGDPTIAELAAKYGKTPAQVVIRWHLQHGLSVIPKSVKAHRIAENRDVFDFELTAEEIDAIDAMDTGRRGGPDPDVFDLDFLAGRR